MSPEAPSGLPFDYIPLMQQDKAENMHREYSLETTTWVLRGTYASKSWLLFTFGQSGLNYDTWLASHALESASL